MNVTKLLLLTQIKYYQPISYENLKRYIDNESSNSFNLIINLFCESHIQINNYTVFKLYVNQIANQYFTLYNNYTDEEKAQLIFLLIIKLYTIYLPDTNLILQDYEKLPKVFSQSIEMKKIRSQIDVLIIPYYIKHNKDFSYLLKN